MYPLSHYQKTDKKSNQQLSKYQLGITVGPRKELGRNDPQGTYGMMILQRKSMFHHYTFYKRFILPDLDINQYHILQEH